MTDDYLQRIRDARVYDVAIRSPLELAPKLSERLCNRVYLKREDLQPVFSFKLRGAYNKMALLSEAEREAGVVAASAGNHAQGVALAAGRMQIRARIVMPRTTPAIKVDAVRRLGAEILLEGDTYDEASRFASELAATEGAVLVHPYDDPDVIAGQGTVGLELHEQVEGAIDAVYVPVGGGGLVSGVLKAMKALRPETRIIGVEPEDAACLKAALDAGERVELSEVGLFADGVAVKQIGEEPFRLCQGLIDDVVTVSVDEICAAVRDVFEDNRSLVEPAGALAVAGLKKDAELRGLDGQTLIAIQSGANLNFDRLRHIAERAELGEHREALLAVTIPERPGSFREFCDQIGTRGITEFNYRYADQQDAHIFVGIKLLRGQAESAELIEALRSRDYPVVDLSSDEMAKVHIRYMVGGRAANVSDEILFRFEFPERPGALLAFLNSIGGRWNISLFHYRNHGAAYGRVLVGMQVPEDERDACRDALDSLHYSYCEETDNAAYRLFLGSA